MKIKLIILFGLIFLFLVNFVSATPISACGSVGTGTWELDRDLSGITGNCFRITADNVVLDLKGHTIEGIGVGYGVDTYTGRNNVTVRKGTIINFAKGINVNQDNGTIEDILVLNSDYGVYIGMSNSFNTLTNIEVRNSNKGFYLYIDADHNSLTNIKAINNTEYGVKFYWVANITLKDSEMSGNGFNFIMLNNNDDEIRHNFESNIIDYSYDLVYEREISNVVYNPITTPNVGAIYCMDCDNITIKNLNLSHHNSHAVFLDNTSNIDISNFISNNNDMGISIDGGENISLRNINVDHSGGSWGAINILYSNNTLLNNISASYTDFWGVYLGNCINTTLTNIVANDNSDEGIWIDNHENTTLINITANNNMNGIVVGGNVGGGQFNMQNIKANNNDYDGIFIMGVSTRHINIFDVVANYNGYSGIEINDYHLMNINNITLIGNQIKGGFGSLGIVNYIEHSTISNIFADSNWIEGITVNSGGLNVTVENITVMNTREWGWVGLYAYKFENSTFNNITIINNTGDGIYLDRSNNNILRNIISRNNSENGIYLERANNNSFYNVESSGNTKGGIFTDLQTYNSTFVDSSFCYNQLIDTNCSLLQMEFTNNKCISGGETCGGDCLSCEIPFEYGYGCDTNHDLSVCNTPALQTNPSLCAWECNNGPCPPPDLSVYSAEGECHTCSYFYDTCGGYNNNQTCIADPCDKAEFDCDDIGCDRGYPYLCFWNEDKSKCDFTGTVTGSTYPCSWTSEITKGCELEDDVGIKRYTSTDPGCDGKDVPFSCAMIGYRLSFFTWINSIAVISLLILVYFLYTIYKKG